MALNSNETMEAFINKIIRNDEIMKIMNLPTILETDSQANKNKKRKLIIDKVIRKTAQIPTELGKIKQEVIIEDKSYKNFGDIRMTISLGPSIKLNSYIFGNPQIDFYIYYDNTNNTDNAFKILDLISNEFSGKNLIVTTNEGKQIIKELKCEGITSQTAIINNYERVGIRFSFYATLYKI